MMNRIAEVLVCLCILGFALLSYAQEGEKGAPDQEKKNEKTDLKSVTGIVLQIVLFVLFLGVIYYVFIYPEKPKSDEGDQQAAAPEKEEPSSGAKDEEASKEDPVQEEGADTDKESENEDNEEGDEEDTTKND